jgi:hypothetical protein
MRKMNEAFKKGKQTAEELKAGVSFTYLPDTVDPRGPKGK